MSKQSNFSCFNNNVYRLGVLSFCFRANTTDLSICFPFSFDFMALSHYFLSMALLCFPAWVTEMVLMNPGKGLVLLSDDTAAQREVWPVESAGIPVHIPGMWLHGAMSIQ